MSFFLPVKALSTNKLWRGGPRYRAREYDDYEREVAAYLPRSRFKGELEVTLEVFVERPAGKRKLDANNWDKALFDIFTKCGLWEDDSQVMAYHVYKVHDEPRRTPGIRVTIIPFKKRKHG